MMNYLRVPIMTGGTLSYGTSYIYAMPIPSDDEGGGITVTNVTSMSNYAIAAASSPQLTVVLLGTAYSGDIAATVASCGSHAWGAGTGAEGTLSTVWCDQDAGHYHMAVQWIQTEVNAGSASAGTVGQYNAAVTIGWQQGR